MENDRLFRYVRIGTWLTGALLAAVCLALVLVLPRLTHALDRMEQTMQRIDALSEDVGSTLETAGEALESATVAANNANQLVVDNSDAVSEAMTKINSVDFEALNKAIRDLADIVEPLARVSNFFNR